MLTSKTRLSLYLLLPLLPFCVRAQNGGSSQQSSGLPYNPIGNAIGNGIDDVQSAANNNDILGGIGSNFDYVADKATSGIANAPSNIRSGFNGAKSFVQTKGPWAGLGSDLDYFTENLDSAASAFATANPGLPVSRAWGQFSSKLSELATITDTADQAEASSEIFEQFSEAYSGGQRAASKSNSGKSNSSPGLTGGAAGGGFGAFPSRTPTRSQAPYTPVTPQPAVTVTVTVATCTGQSSSYKPTLPYAPPPVSPMTPIPQRPTYNPTPVTPAGAPGAGNGAPTQYTGAAAAAPSAVGFNLGAMFGVAGFMGLLGAM